MNKNKYYGMSWEVAESEWGKSQRLLRERGRSESSGTLIALVVVAVLFTVYIAL